MRRLLARAAKFLISSSLLLSLDGALIVIFGCILYGIKINPELTIAAFLAAFSVYNLNKATDRVEDSVNRPGMVSKSSAYYIGTSIVTMLVGLVLSALNGLFPFLILSTPIIIGVFYSVKISKKLPRLKDLLGAKSIFVAFSWSLSGTFLPLSPQSFNFEKIPLVFMYIFVQFLVNTILFDSLDTKGDSAIGIRTIPMALGQNRTRIALLLANSTLILWLTFCDLEGLFSKFIPTLFLGVIYTYLIIWQFLGKNHRRLSAGLIIDGEWAPIVTLMGLIPR